MKRTFSLAMGLVFPLTKEQVRTLDQLTAHPHKRLQIQTIRINGFSIFIT